MPIWHAGYPLPAPDYRFAAFELAAQNTRDRNDRDALFGVIETQTLPALDDPGPLVSY